MRDTNPITAGRLRAYHRNLCGNKQGKLLNRCIWQGLSDGHILDYCGESEKDNSIAQNLDIFQRELSNYTSRRFTICGININTETDFEHLVPLGHADQLLWTIPVDIEDFKFWRPAIKLPKFQDGLGVIIEEHWNDRGDKIADTISETSGRSQSPSQLHWDLDFSRITCEQDMALESEPVIRMHPFQNLDIELEWMSEPPKLGTFLRSHDWNIYVSEPFARRPRLEVLRFTDLSKEGSRNGQAVVATTSHRVLERLKRNIDAAVNTKAIDLSSADIEDVVYGYVVVFLQSVLDDAASNFLQGVARAKDLVRTSDPSLALYGRLILGTGHDLEATTFSI